MTNVEYLLKVNDYLNDSIRFADTKAEVLLTIVSLVGGCTAATAPTVLAAGRSSMVLLGAMLVLALMMGVSVLGAICATTVALGPRLEQSVRSLRSFPVSARMDPKLYVQEVTSLDPTQMAHDVASHNASLSRIAQKKFDALALATRSVGIAIVSASLFAMAYVVASVV